MTILQPGEHWDGLEIVGNDKFKSRRKPPQQSAEELFFSKAVYAAEMCQRQGWDINPETMGMVNPDLRPGPLSDLLLTDKFQNALHARGINMSTKSGLSPRQLAAITVFFDMSTPATITQKLRMAGVSKAEWDGWYRQPAFAARVAELGEDLTAQNVPLAEQRLQQALDSGAPWAIQFALAMNKRFDPRAETVDPTLAMRKLFDILDEILPQEFLDAIEQRMKQEREGTTPQPQVLRIAPSTAVADTIRPSENGS